MSIAGRLLAMFLGICLLIKGWVDVDLSWDTWNYHLPFAARIWNIVGTENYRFEKHLEDCYNGFPLFANFLQGLFWRVSGHVEAANLVNFFSLIVFITFASLYFHVPTYLLAIALLTVPEILIQSTASYIDVISNVFAAILILSTYKAYRDKKFTVNKKVVFFVISSAAIAANSKLQLNPIVFLSVSLFLVRYAFLLWENSSERKFLTWLIVTLVTVFSGILIFATPIKNTLIYGNPAYPVELKIFGRVLPYTFPNPSNLTWGTPGYLVGSPNFIQWLYSIVEFKAYDPQRPNLWTIGQGDVSGTSLSINMGGYFGLYVIFNLLLFVFLLFKIVPRQEKLPLSIFFMLLSLITANMPESHQLRYYMYWMICLITLNLHFLVIYTNCKIKVRFPLFARMDSLLSLDMRAIFGCFLLTVIFLTRGNYVLPKFMSFQDRVAHVDQRILKQLNNGDKACIVGQQPNTFMYSSPFHNRGNYFIEAQTVSGNCSFPLIE